MGCNWLGALFISGFTWGIADVICDIIISHSEKGDPSISLISRIYLEKIQYRKRF